MNMLRKTVAFAALIALTLDVSALTIKVGTLAPPNTPWYTALHELARRWREVTGGFVDMKIYGGGIAGDEADMLRKVRLGGSLQGAALSGTGLNRITSEMLVMNLPLFFDGYDELQYVAERMSPEFESLIEQKGFKLIAWTTVGWVHFFGKQPILTPADLRKQKIAVSAEDEEILYTWRATGFDALPLHTNEILAGLQTGMAEAYHAPPIIAAVYQWFGLTPYMSSIEIAPLLAGLILNERTWRQIPERFHEELVAVSREIMKDLYDNTQELEVEAIEVMKENGLIINEVPGAGMQEWVDLMKRGYDILVGASISPRVYEQTLGYRSEYRAANDAE
jgi:TRAP-type transport system periplasmic protein